MAIYHLSVKTISRSAGRSATAAAAYRAGVEVVDARTGLVHDYTRRSGVESAVITPPAGAPSWALDRSALWNAAEAAELRKNSTVAREFEVALPAELSAEQRGEIVATFARALADRHGVAVDAAIHAPGREGDHRNHHAHILTSTRRLGPEGFGEKARELDAQATGPGLVVEWRAHWAELVNAALAQAGRVERVDHRSLADQGIDRAPTVHVGPKATALERAAVHWSGRGQSNREVVAENAERTAAVASLVGLRAERERRAREAAAAAAARAVALDRTWLAALPLEMLRDAVKRREPPSLDVLAAGQHDARVAALRLAEARRREATAAAAIARHTAGLGEWRDSSRWNRVRAWAHEQGVMAHSTLVEAGEAGEAVEQERGLQAAAQADIAAVQAEMVQQEPAWRAQAARDRESLAASYAVAQAVLTERVAAEKAREANERAVAAERERVREEATELAQALITAADLHRRGELPDASPALVRALVAVSALKGDREAELAKQLAAAPTRRTFTEWLAPHARVIEQAQGRDGPSLGW